MPSADRKQVAYRPLRYRELFILGAALLMAGACADSDQTGDDDAEKTASGFLCDADNGGLTLPDGFCAGVVADNLGVIRHLAVNTNGDLYVSMRHQRLKLGGIIAMRDENGDGRMDRYERISEEPGMGIQIRDDRLYFAADDAVYRYRLRPGQLLPELPPEVLITGFPGQSRHSGKPFALDNRGGLYINIGAESNACQEQDLVAGSPGIKPCPELQRHAGIWKFSDDLPGQTFSKDGKLYASGIRNAYAIDWNFNNDRLYVTQHGRDQLYELWPEHFSAADSSKLPAEEFIEVREGGAYGWPYCYYDQMQQRRVLAPEYGGDGQITDGCEDFPEPVVAFPGHYGPNDLIFYNGDQFPPEYRGGAFIAFHGSYNRGPFQQVGYQVVFVPFDKNGVSGEWRVFADNFAGTEHLQSPQDADFRPTGLAEGPDGSLYITDSVQGRIWRVMYRPGIGPAG